VKDIVEAIEGRICPVPCVEDEKACDRAALCVATRVWKKLRLDIEESLAGFTLAELARQAREEIPRAENYMI
jgi:DNA-binding IscR family transcriptional regulator